MQLRITLEHIRKKELLNKVHVKVARHFKERQHLMLVAVQKII